MHNIERSASGLKAMCGFVGYISNNEGGKRTSGAHVLSHRARVVALATNQVRSVHPLIAAGIMTGHGTSLAVYMQSRGI